MLSSTTPQTAIAIALLTITSLLATTTAAPLPFVPGGTGFIPGLEEPNVLKIDPPTLVINDKSDQAPKPPGFTGWVQAGEGWTRWDNGVQGKTCYPSGPTCGPQAPVAPGGAPPLPKPEDIVGKVNPIDVNVQQTKPTMGGPITPGGSIPIIVNGGVQTNPPPPNIDNVLPNKNPELVNPVNLPPPPPPPPQTLVISSTLNPDQIAKDPPQSLVISSTLNPDQIAGGAKPVSVPQSLVIGSTLSPDQIKEFGLGATANKPVFS